MSHAEEAAVPYNPDEDSSGGTDDAFAEAEQLLMKKSGVTGVGRTRFRDGRDAIVVYVQNQNVISELPSEISGVPIIGDVTGDIRAQ